MRTLYLSVFGFAILAAGTARGADPVDEPRPIPLTRPDMKQLLEEMKNRTPRIPLPELTLAERNALGEREAGYEGRLRSLYMPDSTARSATGFSRDPDPNMTLDYKFKTQLFWIVSRTNNCQYCLGHQESKLLAAGMKETEIAALDSDWDAFTTAERAAYAFARKFTYEPHLLSEPDIGNLRKHFKELQILEMILSMAGNNSINRWKEGVGVPQSPDGGGFRSKDGSRPPERKAGEKQTYLTPTPDEFKSRVTRVAPLQLDQATGTPTRATICRRPALESREVVEKALAAARKRTPRLPLLDNAAAVEVMGKEWTRTGPLPQWVRLLANFPVQGKSRILSQIAADEKGDLTPLLKAQVSWIVARQDRAWYAAGEARRRLRDLGQSDDQVYRLDGDWTEFTPAERSLFVVARKLAASPVVLTDGDVAEALKQTGPREVVQLISYTTTRASFNRITEAAGLQIED